MSACCDLCHKIELIATPGLARALLEARAGYELTEVSEPESVPCRLLRG